MVDSPIDICVFPMRYLEFKSFLHIVIMELKKKY